MKVVYEWLKEYVGDDIPGREKLEELLTFHSFEIEGNETIGAHDVIDVDVLPNRSSDCLSHRGIAREIGTLVSTALQNDPFSELPELHATDRLSVEIHDTAACRRFGAALLSSVTVGASPGWLKERLEAVGQRSINNVVDVTNYVMLSLGQPLHAYDGEKFPKKDGVWQFGVRFAREGEMVTTLSDEEVLLDPTIQVITEAKNDTPVGIAGIKGGKSSEVDETTTTVILEAANFDPAITRKAAQKIKLHTDASKRFENEVPRDVVPYALSMAATLLTEIAGAQLEGYIDVYPTKAVNSPVTVSLEAINARLGLSLEASTVEQIFSRLGFTVRKKEGNAWEVTAPFERTDINIPEDVIEEVGRIYGYENIAPVVPDPAPLREYNKRHYYSEKIRGVLTEAGFSEIITSSFRKKDEICLKNAFASDKGCLRSMLRHNIIEALDKNIVNADLLGLRDIRIFEIGTVFTKGTDGVHEHVSLALGVRTKQQGYVPKDDAVLLETKKALESIGGGTIEAVPEKGILEINLKEVIATLSEPTAYEPHTVGKEVQYTLFSQYPFVTRDIALWTEGATSDEVEQVIAQAAGDLLVRTTLFDAFEKDGRTSYAFRLVFQSYEKTLTDEEVGERMEKVNRAVEEEGWEVR